MKNIEEKIDSINNLFKDLEGEVPEMDMIVRKTLKIGEELGELNEAVLAEMGLQRQEKLDSYKREDLEKELADVVISALTLARYLNIDLEDWLLKRLDFVERRIKTNPSEE